MKVTDMAQLFGITRQGYYKMQKRKLEQKTVNEMVKKKIMEVRKLMPRLGGRKLFYLLKPSFIESKVKLGRDKLFDIMRQELLLVKRRKNFTRTTDSYHRYRTYSNEVKDKKITRPEEVWVSDITYIRSLCGFMYLSLVTDAYSRKIVGYELSDNMKAENTIKALKKAIRSRMYPERELIHHSDRGFQYCYPDYIEMLDKNKIHISMTTKYDPYENAQAERVNGILKGEFMLDKTFQNQRDARLEIERCINVYNTNRPHQSCNFLTPDQAHRFGNYEMKKWSRKNFSKGYPLEKTNYI